MRTEDGRIIQECLNGERGAFGVLVDKYREGIYAFVYDKLQNFQDAQDVTQEVFMQAYRGLRGLRRRESFAFWLYRIAYSRRAEFLRRRSKRVDQDFIADQNPEVMDVPSLNSYRESQLDQSVQEALDSLPDAYREVLMLRYFGGMNSGEIARALGTSPTAIRMRLSRARAQLKKEMVAMMSTTFESQKLPTGFTFRIVETIKQIKISPMPRATGLPWGLALATGIILTILSLSPRLGFPLPMPAAMRPSLSGEAKVLEIGEIAVDVLKISQIPAVAGKNEDADLPHLQNAPALAPHGETTFAEVSEEAGIEDQEHGYSVAFIDHDNDGDMDIHVSNWGWHFLDKPNKL